MIAYIIGNSDDNAENRARYADAEMVLNALGYTVLNPFCLPRLPAGHSMRIDFALLNAADTVCLLPDYKSNSQAKIEYDYARKMRKKILFYKKIDLRRK